MAEDEKVPVEKPEPPEEEIKPMKVSRRDFLVGAGAGVVITGIAAAGVTALRPPKEVIKEVPQQAVQQAPAAGQPASSGGAAPAQAGGAQTVSNTAEVISSGKLIILNVNGRDYMVAVQPQATLIEVLRRDLGLTGTKLGCNGSMCSACSVLVDGVALNSCSLLAIREVGKKIVTIEGLEQNGQLHPVQQAFWDHMGYQCGFCTPGQIIRATELLSTVKQPTDEQILRHMSGNMCKCSAYPNILKAVQTAAQKMA